MKKKFSVTCFGSLILVPALLVLACEQPIPEVEGLTEQIEVRDIPEKIDGRTPYKIFVQISKGTDIEAGYVAKGEVLIDGRDRVVMDVFDPYGQSWAGEGPYNIAVVISPQTVAARADIAVHAAMPKLSSRIQSLTWTRGMMDLGELGMKKQLQDLFEGIVCALKERDVTHPARWESDDEKEVILLLSDDNSFSFNLSEKFGLDILFLVTGSLESTGTADTYKLKDLWTDYTSKETEVTGMIDREVKLEYNADKTEFVLSSSDTAQNYFGATYRKK
ncbi:MAG: hypothetical protein LBP27_02240 [Treponema sp.]|jgi:hypothetical protein|nr:hypothetical protein [Treponema sp.]